MEKLDVWQLISHRAESTPEALATADTQGQRLTFAGLRDEALSVAAALHVRGVQHGTRVSWQLPTWTESFVLMAALSRLGAVQNLVIPILRDREVGFIADEWQPQLLITPGEYRGHDHAEMARRIGARREGLDLMVLEDRLPRADPNLLPEPVPAAPDESRWVLYTSGTTSLPKGVRHTDATVTIMARNYIDRLAITHEDRTAFVAPVTHVGGVALFIAGLLSGSANLLADVFNTDTIAFLDGEGVTLAGMGTTFHEAYLRYRRASGPEVLTTIRAFTGGGASRPKDLHDKLVAEFGAGIHSGYGSTETGMLTMPGLDAPSAVRARTEGSVYANTELRIVRGDNSAADPDETGEVLARGPQMMLGYVAPILTTFDDEGFFHTGDLGSLDADGNLTISGRAKDVIIRMGENISVAEVEDVLRTHPAVKDVAVVGVPDARTGECCCAALVLEPGFDALTTADVAAFMAEIGVARQKAPERVQVLDELPRAGTGKVAKGVLRAMFEKVPDRV